jgi:Zn finger protein HypA/HybF involved in hydrogenase expression
MSRKDPAMMVTSCDECTFVSTLKHFDGGSCTLCGSDSVTVES